MPTTIEKLDAFTSEGGGNVIAGTAVKGDKVRITRGPGRVTETYYTPPVAPTPQPLMLSKTAFMDIATTALGGGQTGRARFQEIIEAAKVFAGATAAAREVRFVHERYTAATSFSKSNVQAMCAILVAASIMTPQENTDLIAAWPNG